MKRKVSKEETIQFGVEGWTDAECPRTVSLRRVASFDEFQGELFRYFWNFMLRTLVEDEAYTDDRLRLANGRLAALGESASDIRLLNADNFPRRLVRELAELAGPGADLYECAQSNAEQEPDGRPFGPFCGHQYLIYGKRQAYILTLDGCD